MAVDLRGVGGDECFSWSTWERCLNVARAYGWKPEGTRPPRFTNAKGQIVDIHSGEPIGEPDPDERWGYYSNDYQTVTDQDAAALAQALNRALAEAPRIKGSPVNEEILFDKPEPPWMEGRLAIHEGGEWALRALAEYAAKGEFVIG